MRDFFLRFVAMLAGVFSALEPPTLPRVVKVNEHPFMKRRYGKVVAGGAGGSGLARLLARVSYACAVVAVVVGGTLLVSHLAGADGGTTLMAMPGLVAAKDLRAARANVHEQYNAVLDAARAEDRGLTSEERETLDRMDAQMDELKGDIDRIERHEARQAELAGSTGRRGATPGVVTTPPSGEERGAETPKGPSDEAKQAAFASFLRNGISRLTPEERSIMQAQYQELSAEQRALAAGTDSAGGFTVPEGFYGQMVEAMTQFGGMRRAGTTVITTDSGNPLPIPTDNDTSNKGARLSENTQVSEQDIVFGAATLNAYMYTSKLVRVSVQLLQDSAFDIGGYLARKLGMRIGRIANQEMTTGTGSSQPEGIVTGATLGVTTAAVDGFTWDELIELEHSVDPDYREMAEWMFSDGGLKVAKKIKDGDGRPIWQPGLQVGEPDRILGYTYVVNQDVADPATGTKSVLFGAMENYFIRDVRGAQLLRLSERYADYLQVGFIAFSRHDGQLVDAGTNPIKYLQHA